MSLNKSVNSFPTTVHLCTGPVQSRNLSLFKCLPEPVLNTDLKIIQVLARIDYFGLMHKIRRLYYYY